MWGEEKASARRLRREEMVVSDERSSRKPYDIAVLNTSSFRRTAISPLIRIPWYWEGEGTLVCDTGPTIIRLSLSVHRIVQLYDHTKVWQAGKNFGIFLSFLLHFTLPI